MRYCIGDIHGCIKTLQKLISQIITTDKEAQLYFVGDYIDRGPDSKSVLDYIIELKTEKFLAGAVRGNHEEMLIHSFMNDQLLLSSLWYQNGAKYTIQSFQRNYNSDSKVRNLIPELYVDLIKQLPYYIELDDYFIVHAGFNFKLENPFINVQSMIWMRNEVYNELKAKGKTIIHGHTPIPFVQIKEIINDKKQKIKNIDSGCVYKSKNNLGSLTAINLDNMELINISNIDF